MKQYSKKSFYNLWYGHGRKQVKSQYFFTYINIARFNDKIFIGLDFWIFTYLLRSAIHQEELIMLMNFILFIRIQLATIHPKICDKKNKLIFKSVSADVIEIWRNWGHPRFENNWLGTWDVCLRGVEFHDNFIVFFITIIFLIIFI